MRGPDNASTYTICDGCTSRLQHAAQFRNQVLECETKFAEYVENYLRGDEDMEHIKEEIVNVNAMTQGYASSFVWKSTHLNEFDGKIEVSDDGNRIGDARYSCDISNEIFCPKDKLLSHVLDNHICSQDSRDLSGLSRDTTFNRRSAEYQCNFCTDTFPKLKSLKSHELIHTEKSAFICNYCQKSFNEKRKLKKHINYHTRNNICETCEYFTAKASTLREHIRNVHDDKMRRLKCGSTKGYNSMSDLKDHKNGNHGSIFSQDSRDLSDLSCDRMFNRRSAEYHCAFCTDTFTKFKSFKSHELTHTEKSGFVCDYCQKSFNEKGKLKKHINCHIGNYRCETCGNSMKTLYVLRTHIRIVHEKIKPFKCDLCPKTYQKNRDLIEHRSVHTGEFSHKCYICFKSFRFQSGLNAHKHRHLLKSIKQDQARIGTESRPDNLNNKCPICGKSFLYKFYMRKHLNTHTKPFQCDVCGKSFSYKKYMVRHQKQHYPGERETKTERKKCSGNRTDHVVYSCDFCKQIFCGKEKLRSHLLAEHMSLDPRNISCPSCGRRFRGRETCLEHLMLHKTLQYHCAFCIDSFPTTSSLRTHEETHTKKSGFICDLCQRGFKLKKTLINHINEHNMGKTVVHSGMLPFKCDVCSQLYRSKSGIHKHKLRHKH